PLQDRRAHVPARELCPCDGQTTGPGDATRGPRPSAGWRRRAPISKHQSTPPGVARPGCLTVFIYSVYVLSLARQREATMTARTGAEYLKDMRDARDVWLGDRRVDITTEPMFAGSLKGMAGYFDWQHRYAEDCLIEDTVSGKPMSASLLVPHTRRDLEIRHRCFDRLAKYSYGMLGRTPDYVGVTLAGFIARADMFDDGTGVPVARFTRFHRDVIEGDLAMTHALIQPTIDRSIGDLQGQNAELALRVVRRTKNGVVVRGGKVLATLAPFADEMFIYPQLPLPPGSENHALC